MAYKMSDKDAAICAAAMKHLNDVSRLAGQRMTIHGDDADGNVDVEFPHVFAAVRWAGQYGVESIIDFRDAVRHITNSVVITFNLYDYAKCRARAGFPVTNSPRYSVLHSAFGWYVWDSAKYREVPGDQGRPQYFTSQAAADEKARELENAANAS